jgi:hypothetical protein
MRISAARKLLALEAKGVIADLFSEITDEYPEPLLMHYLPDEQSQEPSLFPEKVDVGKI